MYANQIAEMVQSRLNDMWNSSLTSFSTTGTLLDMKPKAWIHHKAGNYVLLKKINSETTKIIFLTMYMINNFDS